LTKFHTNTSIAKCAKTRNKIFSILRAIAFNSGILETPLKSIFWIVLDFQKHIYIYYTVLTGWHV